jgi:sulfonate transport system permease protein
VPRQTSDTLVRETESPPAAAAVESAPTGTRRRGWLRLISPVVVVGLWETASATGVLPAAKMPSPVTIVRTTSTLIRTNSPEYGTLQGAMAVSLERVAVGFAIGAVIGIALAVIAGVSRLGELAVDPVAQALRTVPLFGLIPVFIVWFGIGQTPKIALIALAALFPLYLNTFAGIRSIDSKYAELGEALGLRRREVVRQSLGLAWLALVVAEQINAHAGLGFLITQAQQFLQINVIVVVLLVYCVLGLVTDSFVRIIERKALSWHQGFVSH